MAVLTALSVVSMAAVDLALADSHAVSGRLESLPRDDGWRRTASGWENSHDWPLPLAADADLVPARADERPAVGRRYDFHPGGLALLQVAIAAGIAGLNRRSRSLGEK